MASSKPPKTPFSRTLLSRAHSPATTSRIHAEKVAHKPVILYAAPQPAGTSTKHNSSRVPNARTSRRLHREAKVPRKKNRNKPQPLTAREKRALCIYDIPQDERKFALYTGLHVLWQEYISSVLGITVTPEAVGSGQQVMDSTKAVGNEDAGAERPVYVTATGAGPKIAAADMHGAELEVVRSRCVSRVGVKGIVVRDTMFTFEVVTRRNELKVLPKERTVFELRVWVDGRRREEWEKGVEACTTNIEGHRPMRRDLIFELQGEQFQNRAPERATRKFRQHLPKDL